MWHCADEVFRGTNCFIVLHSDGVLDRRDYPKSETVELYGIEIVHLRMNHETCS